MPENAKQNSRPNRYYAGHTRASYTAGLGYHARPYEGSPTFKDMVKRAEQTMTDTAFKD